MRIRDACGAERILALGSAERSVIFLSAQGSDEESSYDGRIDSPLSE